MFMSFKVQSMSRYHPCIYWGPVIISLINTHTELRSNSYMTLQELI